MANGRTDRSAANPKHRITDRIGREESVIVLFNSRGRLFGGTTTKFRLNIVLGCLFLFQPKTFRQWYKPLKVSVSRPRDMLDAITGDT